MKKTLALAAGTLLGLNVLAGPSVVQAQTQTPPAVECKDGSIFKVAQIRPGRMLGNYHLAKYDTINITAIGFPNGFGVDDSKVSTAVGAEDITVGVDGMARLPYVGNVELVGLTLDEASDLIQSKLSKYFKIPELSVSVKTYGPRKVYVMGNVKDPGLKEMKVDNMNVYSAISMAGGVDDRGRSKHVQLLRQIDGVLFYREVNLDGFVKKHDLSQNIELEDGDIVYVPDSGKVIFSTDVAPYINIWAMYRSIVK